jgi:CRP/FNR family cyclic AMP-dependent transcriptional regulator
LFYQENTGCGLKLRRDNKLKKSDQGESVMFMQIVAWLAAALVFASFFMKTIVPLRTFAIVSNVVFIIYALLGIQYGVFDKVLPILILHVALLPLNILRLNEVTRTIRSMRKLQEGELSYDFLTPFMQKMIRTDGSTLFKKGDHAEDVFLLTKGRVYLPDIDKYLMPGALFGEVAIFSEGAKRSTSAVCEEECELHCIKGAKILELFYQDQKFAFHIARAMSGYVAENTDLVIDSRLASIDSRM